MNIDQRRSPYGRGSFGGISVPSNGQYCVEHRLQQIGELGKAREEPFIGQKIPSCNLRPAIRRDGTRIFMSKQIVGSDKNIN